jgi:hypothetical protein
MISPYFKIVHLHRLFNLAKISSNRMWPTGGQLEGLGSNGGPVLVCTCLRCEVFLTRSIEGIAVDEQRIYREAVLADFSKFDSTLVVME